MTVKGAFMKENEFLTQKLSVRMSIEEYRNFKKLCHLEFSQMATIARGLIQDWIDKNKKKLK